MHLLPCFFADSLAVGSLDCPVHRVAYISSVTGKTARDLNLLWVRSVNFSAQSLLTALGIHHIVNQPWLNFSSEHRTWYFTAVRCLETTNLVLITHGIFVYTVIDHGDFTCLNGQLWWAAPNLVFRFLFLLTLFAGVCWYVHNLGLSRISQLNIHSHKVSCYTGGVSLSLYLLPVTNPFSESGRDPRTIVRFPLVSACRLSDSLWIYSVWIIRLRTLSQSPKRAEIAKVMVSPFRSVVRRLIDVFLSKLRYLSRQVSRWETLRYTS